MNEVFDLTSHDFDIDKLDIFIKKSRKAYLVHQPENGKIAVTFTTQDNEDYSCIYFYKSNQEVYDMIKQEQLLDLRHTYIKDFDFEEIDNLKTYKLNIFIASLSFWMEKWILAGQNSGR